VSRKAVGTLLVSISAAAFGTYSLFALLASDAGIGPVSLLLYRFGIASAILAIVALVSRTAFPKGRKLLLLVGLGGLYIGQSFTYLQCLRTSNPITASLLLYLYPAFVTIGSVLFLHEKLTRTKLIALVCAFGGSLLIIGPVAGISGVSVAYGITTAIFYASYLVAGKRVMKDTPPVAATLVILTTAFVAYAIGAAFTGLDMPVAVSGWIGVIGLALVATVVAIGALLAGLDKVSAVEASSLSAIEPLVSAIIAVLFLGQDLKVWHVAGGLLVIVAVLVLARQVADVPAESER
jgi:drug/metabolite transporter (DMT)-like permease